MLRTDIVRTHLAVHHPPDETAVTGIAQHRPARLLPFRKLGEIKCDSCTTVVTVHCITTIPASI